MRVSGREGLLAGPRSPDRAGWVAPDRGRLEGSVVLRSRIAEDMSSGGAQPTVTLFHLFIWAFVCVFVAPVSLSKSSISAHVE